MRELIELVRFPFMDKMYFMEKVQTDKTLCKCCPDIVTETLRNHVFPGEVQSPRTRPRRASGLREAVVVIGGHESPSISSYTIMMTYSSTPSNASCVPVTTMRADNGHGFAVAVFGISDIILSIGGPSGNVWLYQAGLDSWSELAGMNTARDYHQVAVLQGKAYAIGGRISYSPLHITAGVEVYGRSLNKWAESVPLPQPRYRHATAVLDGSIYVIGGRDAENNPTSTVYRFNPGNSLWYAPSNMPERTSHVATAVLNGSIYVAGLHSKVLCYMPHEDVWACVAITGSGFRCSMTVFGGEIYIYGGNYDNKGISEVLWLNQQDKSLKQVGSMPKGLFGHGCVTILKG
ncbi:kelch-like protein 24 [Branchiostoma floridae x Branchiostoma japonicum]